jgi:methanethiol S-methyltransferase
MKRLFWIAFGGVTQLLFACIVPLLFLWLYQGSGDPLGIGAAGYVRTLPVGGAVVLDLALLVQFAIPHSVLMLPKVRNRVERFVPPELYGCVYALVAVGNILLCWWLWQPLPGVVYETTGLMTWLLLGLFLGSWVLLIYSISLTGLGWQTGLTPWLCYVRRVPMPRRKFVTDSLYGVLRHPIYLGFLGLIWWTPRMTSDHLLRAAVWGVYVFAGSVLKDRRLAFYIGERYRGYMAAVRGYPWMLWGPLGRARQS